MHLPHMTADDLEALAMRLGSISNALHTLQTRFPGVYVDLTPDQAAVIRLPVVLGLGDPGPVEMVDIRASLADFYRAATALPDPVPAAAADDPVGEAVAPQVAMAAEALPEPMCEMGVALQIGAALASVVEMPGGDGEGLQRHGLAEDAPLQVGADVAEMPAAPAEALPKVEAVSAAPEPKLGPLTEAEKEKILSMRQAGHPNGVIAAVLNRGVQAIGLFLAKPSAKAAPEVVDRAEDAGFRALGDVAAAVVAEVAPPIASPEAAGEVATPVSDGDAVPGDLTAEERRIWVYLDNLGYKGIWNADLDHELVEMLVGGTKSAQVALDLNVDAAAVKSRWVNLSACILDAKDRPTIDGQKHLLRVLKARLVRARQRAALRG